MVTDTRGHSGKHSERYINTISYHIIRCIHFELYKINTFKLLIQLHFLYTFKLCWRVITTAPKGIKRINNFQCFKCQLKCSWWVFPKVGLGSYGDLQRYCRGSLKVEMQCKKKVSIENVERTKPRYSIAKTDLKISSIFLTDHLMLGQSEMICD